MNKKIVKLIKKYKELKKAECNVFLVVFKFICYYLFFGKRKILARQGTIFRKISNIEMREGSRLEIGTIYRGTCDKHKRTLINIKGKMIINGIVNIAPGVVIDICKGGVFELGNEVSINFDSLIVCKKHIVFGDGTNVGWGCHFFDGCFHEDSFMGGKSADSPIIIGKNVHLFEKVAVCRGVKIADDCKVQAHSVIDRSFSVPNSTILTKREFLVVSDKR